MSIVKTTLLSRCPNWLTPSLKAFREQDTSQKGEKGISNLAPFLMRRPKKRSAKMARLCSKSVILPAENTHSLRQTDLLFVWFGFNQASKYVSNSPKQLNPSKTNMRSDEKRYFQFSVGASSYSRSKKKQLKRWNETDSKRCMHDGCLFPEWTQSCHFKLLYGLFIFRAFRCKWSKPYEAARPNWSL